MRYLKGLVMRLILALLLVNSYSLLYKLLIPLTLYPSFYILKLFGYQATLAGTTILTNSHSLNFIPACAAASAYILLGILILLTKDIKTKTRIKMFLLGSLIILIANIIRIDSLIILLLNGGQNYFETLHLFIWKILSSIFVAGVWIFLIKKFKIKSIPLISDLKAIKNLM
ncbi:MAG: pacearchaeosortase [Candidatus Nanoarchaeia archaeon]|nr:pacearchaeosortase [Candidatus Nanoarchaeia archaeon]